MVEVRTFQSADADAIVLQQAQAAHLACVPGWRDILRGADAAGPVWTALDGGRVLCIAGLSEVWAGRALCWAYLADAIPKMAWVALTRAVEARLDASGFRRIEAEVRAGWAPGERWVRLLGFVPEGVAPGYFPDGTACSRWARVAR